MPFCPNCGAKVDESAKFCPSCGNALKPNIYENQPKAASSKARIKFAKITNIYGAPFLTRIVVINVDTQQELCRTHGGEVLTVDAPMTIGLKNMGLKKDIYKIEPGKKYEAKLVLGALRNKFVVNEIDVFDSDL